jgi:hypothetical protein
VVASSHALTQALNSFTDQILTMAMRYDATWFYMVIEFEQSLSHLSHCIKQGYHPWGYDPQIRGGPGEQPFPYTYWMACTTYRRWQEVNSL